MRTADKADPDPELMTVALRIWPAMLIITLTDLTCLVYIAGISGGYVFFAISVNFLATYVVLWKTIKVTQKEVSGDRKEQVPKEEIPRLEIKNEKDAVPSEEKEESENAAIEMSILAAGTSKDIEEEHQAEEKTEDNKEAQTPPPTETPGLPGGTSEDANECQTEAKTDDKEKVDEAQMPPPPPSSEMPGSGTSKDIESQKEEQQTEVVLENKGKSEKEKKAEKGDKESFIFAASVCSTWIPSVVGDPEQRFFLKAGEPLQCIGLSLVSKNTLHLGKLSRCCQPRHEEFLPCRCDHPRQLWDPQGSSVPSPLHRRELDPPRHDGQRHPLHQPHQLLLRANQGKLN